MELSANEIAKLLVQAVDNGRYILVLYIIIYIFINNTLHFDIFYGIFMRN